MTHLLAILDGCADNRVDMMMGKLWSAVSRNTEFEDVSLLALQWLEWVLGSTSIDDSHSFERVSDVDINMCSKIRLSNAQFPSVWPLVSPAMLTGFQRVVNWFFLVPPQRLQFLMDFLFHERRSLFTEVERVIYMLCDT